MLRGRHALDYTRFISYAYNIILSWHHAEYPWMQAKLGTYCGKVMQRNYSKISNVIIWKWFYSILITNILCYIERRHFTLLFFCILVFFLYNFTIHELYFSLLSVLSIKYFIVQFYWAERFYWIIFENIFSLL